MYYMVITTEYEKAIEFLKVGCNCGCSSKVPKEAFAKMREAFQALSKPEQDIFLMAQLKAMDGGSISASRRLKKKARINKRTLYCWDRNISLCQKTYLNMLGIGRAHFENVRNHLLNNGLLSRVHGNVKRMPQWKTKMVIDKDVAITVKNFLLNYAEVHGLPSPVRNVNRVTQSIIFLPAEMSYKSVHRDFLAGLEEDNTLRALKYDAFRKLWHQLTPYIQIMSPRTDLCDTCQHLRNDLQFKARKEEEAQDLLKRYKEHLAKAKLERNYYNKNTKLAEEHRKLINQKYPIAIAKNKIPYRSVDAAAHYSYDWAQNVHVPHSDQQIGKVYYLSARKIHLFGIQDEAVREQINYVLDENELLGKGPNGTLSLVFDGIKRLNKGEKHLKITCDNAGGQNKNNTTLWFYLYLVICEYYESIELNFMVPGHTKFKCDGSFGLIKRLYRKTTVDCVDHVVDVVKRSSITGLNKARCYNGDEGFQYYDIISGLETYFKKLPGLQKFQHFLFTSANPGIIKTQEFANGPLQEFKLLKIGKSEASKVIKKIKALSFAVLVPPPMELKRQEYLYHNIRPFVRDEFKDITCPRPTYSDNE